MDGYDGMWSMGGMGLIWILILVVVAVGIAALVKYLMSRK